MTSKNTHGLQLFLLCMGKPGKTRHFICRTIPAVTKSMGLASSLCSAPTVPAARHRAAAALPEQRRRRRALRAWHAVEVDAAYVGARGDISHTAIHSLDSLDAPSELLEYSRCVMFFRHGGPQIDSAVSFGREEEPI